MSGSSELAGCPGPALRNGHVALEARASEQDRRPWSGVALGSGGFGLERRCLDSGPVRLDRGPVQAVRVPDRTPLLLRRVLLPVGLTLLTLIASVVTHLAGVASGEGVGEAAEGVAPTATIVPAVVGPLVSLLLLGAIWRVRSRSLSSWWFVLVPPIAFGLQEVTERLFDVGSVPFGGTEPSLAASVLMQLPFALMAVVLARLLRAAARKVVAFLRVGRAWPRGRFAVGPSWTTPRVFLPSLAAPAGVHLGRAPPAIR